MTRRSMAALLYCLAVVLFLSRYAISLWFIGPRQYNSFDLALNQIGIAPWVLAGGFLIAGVVYMIFAEREK